ncbi:hypothetical protein [Arsenicibacter rosenii]|uniref:Uncharacterized protein n=1 Tax=Arsenicibacter rosenii TaxID=1750698 RepID=A0A1S2VQY2_9BACT|nr:hypothetical protein [Arsenicibacter rosenii]OIN61197.1 hypothetical protein BLX24_03815 [Arsenicibacter rosenii]
MSTVMAVPQFVIEVRERFQLRIESHLIEVAQAWCQRKNYVRITTLEDFYLELQREIELYRLYNQSSCDNVGLRFVDNRQIEISSRITLKDRPADSVSAVIIYAAG